MECSTPPPLSDETLSAVLDGELTETTRQHLAQCPFCVGRLEEMRKMDTVIMNKLRPVHPSPQQIGDYLLGYLDAELVDSLQHHLEWCPLCQNELELHQQYVKIEEEPALNPIISLWPPHDISREKAVRINGSNVLKGLNDDETTHDVRVGTARIFLEMSTTPKGYLLSGQVIDSEQNWASAAAELWQADAFQQVSVLDEGAEFRFEFTAASPVSLYITPPGSGGATIAIEDIPVQP